MKERMKTCRKCKGKGYVTTTGVIVAELVCSLCRGRGKLAVGVRPRNAR